MTHAPIQKKPNNTFSYKKAQRQMVPTWAGYRKRQTAQQVIELAPIFSRQEKGTPPIDNPQKLQPYPETEEPESRERESESARVQSKFRRESWSQEFPHQLPIRPHLHPSVSTPINFLTLTPVALPKTTKLPLILISFATSLSQRKMKTEKIYTMITFSSQFFVHFCYFFSSMLLLCFV